jgi:hypothetical protein
MSPPTVCDSDALAFWNGGARAQVAPLLDLTYEVREGMLFIASTERQEALRRQVVPPLDHSYLVAGHCVLALIAAVIGGVLAPIISDRRPVPTPSGRSVGTALTELTRA